ncbi:hypothetical protein BKE38_16375 [Pseudoroseomonas deserti]|uniref:histidine kinase n=1 Tax=Teichococcus deserti TaxID=1817963 RepID=A0A1V2H205_9PROT|nr:DUF4118 domain-containing protein [Pseudoroseomonas deserti]ONG51275.1 hypothetical protein BKE38_16375 [Pseudoroseomonas deserti]
MSHAAVGASEGAAMLNGLRDTVDAMWQRPLGQRWLLGLLAFLIALLLRLGLDGLLPPGFPFLTFFPAILTATLLGGLGPGIAVGLSASLAAWYCFMEPFYSFKLTGGATLALGFFVAISAVDILLIHLMQLAMRRLREEAARGSREGALSQQLARTREVMLQELQHRIANNLQVLSAMVLLQRNAVRDPEARRVLDNAATRLEVIGRIQRRLQGDANGLPFGPFLESLSQDLLAAAEAGRVATSVEADPLVLPPELTVPVALIVAELLANALQHGFPDGRRGTVTIRLARAEQRIQLTVEDDGIGLPLDFRLERTRSLGLRIVQALTRQIGGAFTMRPTAQGTTCHLFFWLSPQGAMAAPPLPVESEAR